MRLPPERRTEHYTLLSGLLADVPDLAALQSFLTDHPDPQLLESLIDEVTGWEADEESANVLHREYTSLFLLPSGVKPYESVYRGSEPLLMRKAWVDVRQFYRSCGWQVEESALPEDHAAVELSFMAHLLSDGALDEASAFFHEHLFRWIPQLFRDMGENRHADFYRAVARYGRAFLQAEERAFGEDTT